MEEGDGKKRKEVKEEQGVKWKETGRRGGGKRGKL